MQKIVLWIWQLPQNLIGFILCYLFKRCFNAGYTDITIHHLPKCRGVCLGNYIFIDSNYWFNDDFINVVKHEYGHSLQSRKLGCLYLFVVGIPSVCLNLWDILFHRKWTVTDRHNWYYSKFPENWADKLGNIER